MPGITISAAYGAGGSTIAPAVAARLGWPFLDRAISSTVAERLHLPVEEVEAGGPNQGRLARFIATLAPLALQTVDPVRALEEPEVDEAAVRRAAEDVMRDAVRSGGAVVLGRAGMCALLHEPDVLRVRLYGAREARIRQAAVVESVPLETAQRRIDQVDPAREAYVQRLYGRNPDDPSLYDLQLDSTRLPLPACVDLVVTAFERLAVPDS
jgi:cytidylate kinase